MATSGHTVAQVAQPVHSPLSLKQAGWYPAAFILFDKEISFRVQKDMHTSHPLQNSWSISMRPFALILWSLRSPSLGHFKLVILYFRCPAGVSQTCITVSVKESVEPNIGDWPPQAKPGAFFQDVGAVREPPYR